MQQLRDFCKALSLQYSGRVTKVDLQLLVCQHCHISTSGDGESSSDGPSAEKPGIPGDVFEAYKRLPSFSYITAGWSVPALYITPFWHRQRQELSHR